MTSIKGQILDTRLENVQDLENINSIRKQITQEKTNNDISAKRDTNHSEKHESVSKKIDNQNTENENEIMRKTNDTVQDKDKSKETEKIITLPDDNDKSVNTEEIIKLSDNNDKNVNTEEIRIVAVDKVNERNIFNKISYKRIQKIVIYRDNVDKKLKSPILVKGLFIIQVDLSGFI